MAFLNKTDIDIINNVFEQRNQLQSINQINNRVIYNLEVKNSLIDSVMKKQQIIIQNNDLMRVKLEKNYNDLKVKYEKDIKKQKNQTNSFQALTGIGLVVIIILLL